MGIRIKTNSVRGGVIENMFFRNITIGQVDTAVVHITMNYEEGDAGPFVPAVRNIVIENLQSRRSGYAMFIDCYARSPAVNSLVLRSSFANASAGQFLRNVAGLQLTGTIINGSPAAGR